MRLASAYHGSQVPLCAGLLDVCTSVAVLGSRLAAQEGYGHEHAVDKVPAEVSHGPMV